MARPLKPIISKEAAAKAALAVIDEEGIEGLSMGKVARRVGARAPSFYHHFQNKAELLSLAMSLILRDNPDAKPKPGSDWKEAIVDLAVSTRRSILRHPRAALLFLQFFPRHVMLKPYERWIQMGNLAPELRLQVIEGMETLTLGSAVFSAIAIARGIPRMPKFDAAKFPHLDTAMRSNRLNEEQMFVAQLRRFLSAY